MSKILVIGDLILDEYVNGTCSRLSPEAPIPVVNFESSEFRLGGAGNVAANIKSLGGDVDVVGTVSDIDEEADRLKLELTVCGVLCDYIVSTDKRTTHKIRIVGNNQQIVRLDKETTGPLSKADETTLCERIATAIHSNPSAIIIADYAKSVITQSTFDLIRDKALDRKIPVFLDPSPANAHIYKMSNWAGNIMTPNTHEAETLSGVRITDNVSLEQAGRYLVSRFGCEHVLITRGEHGMSLFASNGLRVLDVPVDVKAVFDVSGAGDTVIATLALTRIRGYDILDAATLANKAAGVVVGKRGTAVVTPSEMGWMLT